MHIADKETGILGANGVVGAGIPLAAGAALSSKLPRHAAGCCVFLRRRCDEPRRIP